MNYQSLIERKLVPQGLSGKEIIYACPFCENLDSGHHLYVNYDKNAWHCVKCGTGSRKMSKLLKALNIAVDFDYDSIYTEQESALNEILDMKSTDYKKDILLDYSTDIDALNYYYHYHIIDSYLSPQAYAYLKDRGFTDDTIIRLKMTEGVNRYGDKITYLGKEFIGRDYSGRIMIPSLTRDGRVSFYLGRDYTGTRHNKYSNAPKEIAVASEDVWGLDTIEESIVVICEGALSAASVDNAVGKHIACATYGKSIAQKSSDISVRVTSQGEKLLRKRFKTYIIFYDRDALEDAYKNAQYLYDRGANVKVVIIPDDICQGNPKADAGDMTRDEILRLLSGARDHNEFSKLDLTL